MLYITNARKMDNIRPVYFSLLDTKYLRTATGEILQIINARVSTFDTCFRPTAPTHTHTHTPTHPHAHTSTQRRARAHTHTHTHSLTHTRIRSLHFGSSGVDDKRHFDMETQTENCPGYCGSVQTT